MIEQGEQRGNENVRKPLAANEVARLRRQLAAARDSAVRAVADAEQAGLHAIARVGEFNELIRGAAGELREQGLVMEADATLVTGATRDGKVRVEGEWWLPVAQLAVHGRSAGVVAASAFGQRLPLGWQGIPPDFLERIPQLPAHVPSGSALIVQGARPVSLVGVSERDRAQAERDSRIEWTEITPAGPRRSYT